MVDLGVVAGADEVQISRVGCGSLGDLCQGANFGWLSRCPGLVPCIKITVIARSLVIRRSMLGLHV